MMPIYRTNDPHKDFERLDADREAELNKLPKCTYCDQAIQEEFAYYINDEWICEECLNDNFRKAVEDHVS